MFIRKGSKKIWRILLGKNSSVYSVQRAFVRHDHCRESYTKLGMDDKQHLQNSNQEKNDEIMASETEQYDIDKGKHPDIETCTINDEINKKSPVEDCANRDMEVNREISGITKNEDFDSLPNRGRKLIVKVHLEHSKFSDDNEEQNIKNSSEEYSEQEQNIILSDELSSSNRNSKSGDDSENNQVLSEEDRNIGKSSKDYSEQEQNLFLSDEISSSNKSVSERSGNNESKPKQNDENGEQNKDSSISRKKREANEISEKENKNPQKTPKNENQAGKTNSPLQENRKQNVTVLVHLFEQQVIPSPIYKLTSAKRTPLAPRQDKTLNFDRINSTECRIETPSTSKTGKTKSKDYDLIDYTSIRLESLMTQFSSQCHPRSAVENTVLTSETTNEARFEEIPDEKQSSPREEKIRQNRDELLNAKRTLLEEKKASFSGKFEMEENFGKCHNGVDSNNKTTKYFSNGGEIWKKLSVDDMDNSDISYYEKQDNSIRVEEMSNESREPNSGYSASNESSYGNRGATSAENVYTASFPDLNGLAETAVDTSCDSIPSKLGECSKSSGAKDKLTCSSKSRSDDLDEITVEHATLERNKTRRNVEGRIPSFRMDKFKTFFKKSSLKNLYRVMKEKHEQENFEETPIDRDVQEKFVCNIFGPSIQKNKRCC